MTSVLLRRAGIDDLLHINAVIAEAVAQWDLPERVKRLSLSSYQYDEADFSALQFVVAEAGERLVGMVSWEPASGAGQPPAEPALLLHGLYVLPRWQGRGIGSRLFAAVEEAARAQAYRGILVRAQAGAGGFFRNQHMHKLDTEAQSGHYAHSYWKAISGQEGDTPG